METSHGVTELVDKIRASDCGLLLTSLLHAVHTELLLVKQYCTSAGCVSITEPIPVWYPSAAEGYMPNIKT